MKKVINKSKLIFYSVLIFVFNITLTKAGVLYLTEQELTKLIFILIISSMLKLIATTVFIYCLAYYIFISNNKNRKKFSRVEKYILIIITFIIYFIQLELSKG